MSLKEDEENKLIRDLGVNVVKYIKQLTKEVDEKLKHARKQNKT